MERFDVKLNGPEEDADIGAEVQYPRDDADACVEE